MKTKTILTFLLIALLAVYSWIAPASAKPAPGDSDRTVMTAGKSTPSQLKSNQKCGKSVTWDLDKDGTLVLSGTGATYDYFMDEAPWISDESFHATAYYDEEWNLCPPDIKNIRIEEGITVLGEGIFAQLTVSNIHIAKTVQSISMPWEYKTISGIDAENLYFRVVDNVLFNADMTELLAHPVTLEEIGSSYHVPEGVKTVSGGQFYSGTVFYPESVTKINAGAATMYIYNRTCEIDEFAFMDVIGQHVIYGHEGSTAEAFAKEIDFAFISFENPVINTYGARQIGSLVFISPYIMPLELLQLSGEGARIETKESVPLPDGVGMGSGMKIVKQDGTELTIVLKGDNDGDGKVSTNDARNALRASIGLDHQNAWQTAASLITNDKAVGTADARMILRAAIGLDTLALV